VEAKERRSVRSAEVGKGREVERKVEEREREREREREIAGAQRVENRWSLRSLFLNADA